MSRSNRNKDGVSLAPAGRARTLASLLPVVAVIWLLAAPAAQAAPGTGPATVAAMADKPTPPAADVLQAAQRTVRKI